MILYKEPEELRPYFPFDINASIDTLEPYLRSAGEEYIVRFIGQDQYDDLLTAYNDDPGIPMDQEDINLLHRVRIALTNFAAAEAVPFLNVNVGTGGITRRKTNDSEAAYQWSVDKLERGATNKGWQGIELLLKFLEDNIADYPIYAADPLYSIRKQLFIRSALQFNDQYNISNQFRTYQAFLPVLKRIEEQEIKSWLSPDFYAELKDALLNDTVTPNQQKVIDLIRPALAHLTIAAAAVQLQVKMDDRGITVYEGDSNDSSTQKQASGNVKGFLKDDAAVRGGEYLQKLKKFLDDNADDYPTYKASDVYSEEDFCPRFDNEAGQGYYFT